MTLPTLSLSLNHLHFGTVIRSASPAPALARGLLSPGLPDTLPPSLSAHGRPNSRQRHRNGSL